MIKRQKQLHCNLSRRRVDDAISEMGRDEVLDARMVLAGA